MFYSYLILEENFFYVNSNIKFCSIRDAINVAWNIIHCLGIPRFARDAFYYETPCKNKIANKVSNTGTKSSKGSV